MASGPGHSTKENVAIAIGKKSVALTTLLTRMGTHASVSVEDKARLEADVEQQELSLGSLQALAGYLSAHEQGGMTLHQYLKGTSGGSRLIFPASCKPPPAPSDALVKRREYLKLRQEAREYNKMVYGTETDPRVAEIMNAGNHYASARNQLAISANMVMSVLASFAISYYAGRSFKASSTTVRLRCNAMLYDATTPPIRARAA